MLPERLKIEGFTLVELLVVIAMLGVLATIGLTSFSSAQIRGRDTQRKSDLKQIASALELYFNDYEAYPLSQDGQILGCPSTSSTACAWGTGSFNDSKTTYMKILPADPINNLHYYYRTININGSPQAFQLYAHIENSQDTSACIEGSCLEVADLPSDVSCGSAICNFSITSANTTPTSTTLLK